jgi:hypothetical protein
VSFAKAGISVAHIVSVMRLSEPITIYLAAGASFGVSRYLCATGLEKSRRRAALEGITAALLWPLAAAAILTKRLRHTHEGGHDAGARMDERVAARVKDASRAFTISVNKLLEAVRASEMTGRETMEQTLYAIRETAEQYVGLAEIKAHAYEHGAPAKHEAELARISGLRGDELLIAARCAHRRNVSRIHAHYKRERSRLLGKLAELRGVEDGALSYSSEEVAEAQRRSEARLEIYLRAVALFSLMEDRTAAMSASELADAECLTLRQLGERKEAATNECAAVGEERCTENASQLICKDPLRATTFTQG